jgi:5-methylcytosine-specific restriction protein A
MNRVEVATVVDHIVPHKDNLKLFWDKGNWQALCAHCHSSVKQSEELGRSAYDTACDINGLPIDPKHVWNR